MEYSNLENFDANENGYNSSINSAIQNVLSTEEFNISTDEFNIGEKKTIGEGYTELGSLAEMTVPTLLKYGGISKIKQMLSNLTENNDASDLTDGLLNNANDILNSAKQGISNAIDTITNNFYGTADNALSNIQNSQKISNIDDEFGADQVDIMNELNGTSFGKVADTEIVNKVGSNTNEMTEMTDFSKSTDITLPETTLPETTTIGTTALTESVGETVGLGVADALGVGEVVSLALGIVGLAGGGYSLFKGFEDIFDPSKPKPNLPTIPDFQNVSIPNFVAT